MKYKNIFVFPFYSKRENDITTSILCATFVIGAVATYYLLNKKKKSNKTYSSNLGNIISDVRSHIKKSTENLLGLPEKRHDASKIIVPSAGTTNWKKPHEKSIFPNIPDPSIRIN